MEEKYRYTQIKNKGNGKVIEAKLEVIRCKIKKYNNLESDNMTHKHIGNYQEVSELIHTHKEGNKNNKCNNCSNCQYGNKFDVIENDTYFDRKENVEIDD